MVSFRIAFLNFQGCFLPLPVNNDLKEVQLFVEQDQVRLGAGLDRAPLGLLTKDGGGIEGCHS